MSAHPPQLLARAWLLKIHKTCARMLPNLLILCETGCDTAAFHKGTVAAAWSGKTALNREVSPVGKAILLYFLSWVSGRHVGLSDRSSDRESWQGLLRLCQPEVDSCCSTSLMVLLPFEGLSKASCQSSISRLSINDALELVQIAGNAPDL